MEFTLSQILRSFLSLRMTKSEGLLQNDINEGLTFFDRLRMSGERELKAVIVAAGFPRAKFPSAEESGKHPPYQPDENQGYKYVDQYSNHLSDLPSALSQTALSG